MKRSTDLMRFTDHNCIEWWRRMASFYEFDPTRILCGLRIRALVFSKNLNSFSLPIFVLNRYSIDFWSLSNPSNTSTLSARYSEHSSTKWVGFWSYTRKTKGKRKRILKIRGGKSPDRDNITLSKNNRKVVTILNAEIALLKTKTGYLKKLAIVKSLRIEVIKEEPEFYITINEEIRKNSKKYLTFLSAEIQPIYRLKANPPSIYKN